METPFPHADCRKLLKTTSSRTPRYHNFVAHLDMYFSGIAGYCSWGRKILQWPDEKVIAVREELAPTFFEKYPQYRFLATKINARSYPDLYAQLMLYEQIRNKLVSILDQLLENRRLFSTE